MKTQTELIKANYFYKSVPCTKELPGLLKYKCYIIFAKSGSSAISQSSIQRFPSTGLLQMPYR